MGFIAEGIRRVRSDRTLWPFVWRPLLWSGLVYSVLVIGGLVGAYQLSGWAVASFGLPAWLGGTVGVILFAILWWFVAGIIFISLCTTFSSAAWDRLSLLVEQEEGLDFTPVRASRTISFVDLAVRLAFGALMGLVTMLLGWLVFGVVGILIAGTMSLVDFTSSAMGRRGVLFFGQWREVFRLPGWPTFLLGAGIIAATPFLVIFLYPSLVVAGTLLVRSAHPPIGAARKSRSPEASRIER